MENNPRQEHLVPVARPDAVLIRVESQLPLLEDGVHIDRYTTRHKVVFEKHTDSKGCATWYHVTVP